MLYIVRAQFLTALKTELGFVGVVSSAMLTFHGFLSSKNEVFLIYLIIFFIRIARICDTVNKEYVKDDYDGGDTVRLYTLDGKCNISGERIKSARTKAKLTQDQLAARLQVAGLQMGQMAISRIESGKRLVPDFELPIIVEALNVSTDWLLGIEKG